MTAKLKKIRERRLPGFMPLLARLTVGEDVSLLFAAYINGTLEKTLFIHNQVNINFV